MLIKAALWPLDDRIDGDAIERLQDELHVKGRIVRYRDPADGKRYFEVVNFAEHQHPNRKVKSQLPAPSESEMVVSTAQALFEHNHEGAVVVVVGVDGEGEAAANERSESSPVDDGSLDVVSLLRNAKSAKNGGAA